MHSKLSLTVLAVACLSGCSLGVGSGKFACPGMPNGIVCKSPAEVYALTNVGDATLDALDTKALEKNPFTRPAISSNSGPVPVLEEPQVMRVWIAPWVDDKKDLHWPSYLFTEVTPRRWSFGGVEFNSQKPLVPVEADYHTPTTAKEKSSPQNVTPTTTDQSSNIHSIL